MHHRNPLAALTAALALAAAGVAGFAYADINVGVTLSATGPAASTLLWTLAPACAAGA